MNFEISKRDINDQLNAFLLEQQVIVAAIITQTYKTHQVLNIPITNYITFDSDETLNSLVLN